MRLRKITHVLYLSSFLIFYYVSSETSCPVGFFGSRCNHKCRCVNNNCEKTGQCIDPFICLGGWFGPECQYVDIAYRTPNNTVLTDGDDSTCLLPTAPETVTIKLNESVVFTWLRVLVQDQGWAAIGDLSLTFSLNMNDFNCLDLKKVVVDNTTLDMHCNLNQTINKVTLKGAAVTSLCSVYVSGECSLGQFGKGCSQTCSSNCEEADNTTATSCNSFTGVCLEGCKPGFTGALCDTECVGTFGQDCNQTCSLTCVQPDNTSMSSCDRITGVCLMGCKAGYSGAFCDTGFSPGTNVKNGSFMCSKNCEQSGDVKTPSCNKATGVCTNGCKSGFTGASCTSVCAPGSFGKDCRSKCSDSCQESGGANDSMCNPVTGACLRGCKISANGVYCRSVASEASSGGLDLEHIIGICSIFAAALPLAYCLRKKRHARPSEEMTADSLTRLNN